MFDVLLGQPLSYVEQQLQVRGVSYTVKKLQPQSPYTPVVVRISDAYLLVSVPMKLSAE